MKDIIEEILNIFTMPMAYEVEAHSKMLSDKDKDELMEKVRKKYKRKLVKLFNKLDKI